MIRFLIIFVLFCSPAYADTATRFFKYQPTSTVTNTNLNGNLDNLVNTLNSLNNENANVDGGFRFIEILSALPAAGNQGRVVFDTGDNTLNFDTGVSFLATALLNNSQTFTGTNTFSGNVIVDGNFNANGTNTLAGATTVSGVLSATNDVTLGAGAGNSITFNANDGLTFTPAATWTFSGNQTVSGTWADLGIVTTADINGGTLDGVQIGGTTATGELFVNDSSDNADGLGSQGTSGQFLQSTGTGNNPAFANLDVRKLSTTVLTTATNSGNIAITAGKRYIVFIQLDEDSAGALTAINWRFDSDAGTSDYAWYKDAHLFNTSPTSTLTGDDADSEIEFGVLPTNNGFSCVVHFDATADISGDVSIFAQCRMLTSGSAWESRTIEGVYKDAGTLTDFELIVAGGTVSGEIITYEFL